MSRLYKFRQNNSHGKFIGSQEIYIEADNAREANSIATEHGVYFDGCDKGIDCSCCGDRWYPVSASDSEHFFTQISFNKSMTKADLLKNYPEEMYEKLKYSFDEPTYSFFFKKNTSVHFSFTKEDIELLKKQHRVKKKSFYAFSYYHNWNMVTDVVKVYESDFDNSRYYDAVGNFGVYIKNSKPGIYIEGSDSPIYCSYETRAEAVKEREKIALIFEEIKAKARDIINTNATSIDDKIKNYLLKTYK